MFLLLRDKILLKKEERRVKKVLGILVLTSFCILLGLSVGWSRERDVSLVSVYAAEEKRTLCYQ